VPEDRDPQPVRTCSTFTAALIALADWLAQCGIDTVAMESTGVYWIPVYELLEARGFAVKLVEPSKLKMIASRKADVCDCQWLQQLHTFGLWSGSFRPDDQICVLRSSRRQRDRLVRYASQHIQHMQQALMQMHVQLHHVIDDISWLCVCPGNKKTGGRLSSGRMRKNASRAARIFRLAAYALARSQTALGAFYRRLKARLGPAKALTATAHTLAKIVYNMLRYGKAYVDRGAAYYEQQYRERVLKNLQHRAKQMGFELVPVTVTPAAGQSPSLWLSWRPDH